MMTTKFQKSQANVALDISFKTVYGNTTTASRVVRGYVDIKVMDAPVASKMTYIVVLDKSSSMLEGKRYPNIIQGFRVLNALLSNTDNELIVIPFNDNTGKIYGPHTPPLPLELMDEICKDLVPDGGTDIGVALSKAYELAATSTSNNCGVTILLLTDGCDSQLQDAVDYRKATTSLFRKMANAHSVFLCLVGICHDADATLLGGLALLGNGTYTLTADSDIGGLIGSMVAMSRERIHDKFEIVFPGGEKKLVSLSRARATRVAFAIPAMADLECWVKSETQEWHALKQMTVVDSDEKLESADVDCITMAFENIGLCHKEQIAKMGDGTWTTTITEKALDEYDALKMEFMAEAIHEIEAVEAVGEGLRQTKADIQGAMRNASLARSLSHRVASDASTVRNSGMSIGMGSHETPTQNAMRSMSAAMSF